MACYAEAVSRIYQEIRQDLDSILGRHVITDTSNAVSPFISYNDLLSLTETFTSTEGAQTSDTGTGDGDVTVRSVDFESLNPPFPEISEHANTIPKLRGTLKWKEKVPEFNIDKPIYFEELFNPEFLATLAGIIGDWIDPDGTDIGIPFIVEDALRVRSAERSTEDAALTEERFLWGSMGFTDIDNARVLSLAQDVSNARHGEQIRYFSLERTNHLLETKRLAGELGNAIEGLYAAIHEGQKSRRYDVAKYLNEFDLRKYAAFLQIYKVNVQVYSVLNNTMSSIYEQDQRAMQAQMGYIKDVYNADMARIWPDQERLIFNSAAKIETFKIRAGLLADAIGVMTKESGNELQPQMALDSAANAALNVAAHISASGNTNSTGHIGQNYSVNSTADYLILDTNC